MKESFSIRFVPNPIRDNVKQGKIYIRIIVNRKKAEIATEHIIESSLWDAASQRVKRKPRLNEELVHYENEILAIKRELVFKGKPISAKIIKDLYTGAGKSRHYLLDYYEKYYQSLQQTTEFAHDTVRSYNTTLGHLRKFLLSKQVDDMRLVDDEKLLGSMDYDVLPEQVDYTFIREFDEFMMTRPSQQYGKPMGRNSANKQHTRFKKVLNTARKEGLMENRPYEDFELKSEKTNRDFLTEVELQKMKAHDLHGNESLIKVRDIFLFSVYTGLRFAHAMSLKRHHVVQDKEGAWWFDTEQGKTNGPLYTPLLKPAVEIMEKYDNEERKVMGNILPKISNVKVNLYLKTIADITGIHKHITHHVARHTFATTITLSNDVPLEVVSKLLGHTEIKTTQIYAKITTKYLGEHARRLEGKL